MGKPITREYTLALEQLYQLALDAATSARYLIKERNDENFSFVVETRHQLAEHFWHGRKCFD